MPGRASLSSALDHRAVEARHLFFSDPIDERILEPFVISAERRCAVIDELLPVLGSEPDEALAQLSFDRFDAGSLHRELETV